MRIRCGGVHRKVRLIYGFSWVFFSSRCCVLVWCLGSGVVVWLLSSWTCGSAEVSVVRLLSSWTGGSDEVSVVRLLSSWTGGSDEVFFLHEVACCVVVILNRWFRWGLFSSWSCLLCCLLLCLVLASHRLLSLYFFIRWWLASRISKDRRSLAYFEDVDITSVCIYIYIYTYIHENN